MRRAIYKKRMLFNKYKKFRSPLNWEKYRLQRNHVTKLKKTSMRVYFFERCAGGPKSKDFWPTIKPFLSKKGSDGGSEILLSENDKIISDQKQVCEVFNDFFVNVAKDIGNSTGNTHNLSTHPSVMKISENIPKDTPNFSFKEVTTEDVHKIVSKFDTKKATGVDGISTKLLKFCLDPICRPLSRLINTTIVQSKFPPRLKAAQVLPLFKKKDPLNKENFRPVSILPIISKTFERIMHDQLSVHFDNIFDPYLAAFRKGFGCQTTLLRLLEDWKKALDRHEFAAAILMDLSKAFDCLPHDLLLEKLKAYGLTANAVGLLESYLSDRKQQVRIGSHTSSWENIMKGVPQGSILGPLLFNIFLNDIFYFVTQANLYNYADDNTLSFIHKNLEILKRVLEEQSQILIEWFTENFMKANPNKFQTICVGQKAHDSIKSFLIDNVEIKCEDSVTLLGVNIDFLLNFNIHVSEICKKASKQLAVLKRLGRFLTKNGKMAIYNSFIASNFNYCPIVWHFCSVASTNKMEKIQERALRFIHNDFQSSTDALLAMSGTSPLHIKRMKLMACEVYKIVNDLSPQYIRDLINIKVSQYNFRSEHQASLPQVNSSRYGLKSFRYEAARIWNSLPNNIRTAESFCQFKRLIRTWDGINCKCSSCSV